MPGYDGTLNVGALVWLVLRLMIALYLLASALARFDRKKLTPPEWAARIALAALIMFSNPVIYGPALLAAVALLVFHNVRSKPDDEEFKRHDGKSIRRCSGNTDLVDKITAPIAETLHVSVWRGNDAGGQLEDFDVPAQTNQTVLDVVSWIQQNSDPTLTYRYACRVGMCGSCAMMVNGEPRWTCRTHVKKVLNSGNRLEIAPLRNLPVIKDLAADMDPFFEKWVAAEAVHHPSKSRSDPIEKIDAQSAERVEANAGIECINCAVCYASCDTVAGNPDYLGPAALQRAWTLYKDQKDANHDGILAAVSGSGGCHNCHSQGSCTRYCPNELNPMTAIAG